MNELPPIPSRSAPTGYLSDEDKRRFTITAGILGAVFILGQFALPLVALLAMLPMMVSLRPEAMKTAAVERCAYWQGNLWFLEWSGGGPARTEKSVLKKLVLRPDASPVTVTELPGALPWLLAAEDRLWIISSSKLGYVDPQGGTHFGIGGPELGDISRPFLYQGSPAVIVSRPEGLSLTVFQEPQWLMESPTPMSGTDPAAVIKNLQVVSQDDVLHVFHQYGSTLYTYDALPSTRAAESRPTQTVGPAGRVWQALMVKGAPIILRSARDAETGAGIQILEPLDGIWRASTSYQIPLSGRFGAAVKDSEGILVVSQVLPGSLRVSEIRDERLVRTLRFGDAGPFSRPLVLMMLLQYAGMVLLPLTLALVLSTLMRKHRVCSFEGETGPVPFATLPRRAGAELVDAAIVGAPFLLALGMMAGFLFDPEALFDAGLSAFWTVTALGLMLGGLVWAFLSLLIFSWLEGKYGCTPGKWAFGIRVLGTELSPCGFGRALIRNLLKIVDGFFSFMVGVMLVALSENWQRIGDMAARTIVVQRNSRDLRV